MAGLTPGRSPRPRPAHSMSVRLLVLVVSVVLLLEGLIFLASISRERTRWMDETLRDAQIAGLALRGTTGPLSPQARMSLIGLTDAETIRLLLPEGVETVMLMPGQSPPEIIIDLDQEDWLQGFGRAMAGLVQPTHRLMEIIGTGPLGLRLDLVVPQASLARFLRLFAVRFMTFAALIAVFTGLLLFFSLRALLVLPLQRITRNIMVFRDDPEHGVPLDVDRVSLMHDDEIAIVGRELSALQAELRGALWRNARLAAVGTAVAKMSHDLRGILSPALLVADRLTMNKDAVVQQAGEVIVRAVHRATALAQHTLDFVREGPPPLARARTPLAGLIEEAAAAADPARACPVHHAISGNASINVDRSSMLRVLTNLFRNAAQAGATAIDVTAAGEDAATVLTVSDNATGLPAPARAHLFRPFAASSSGGSGLGLAIARDLMRAHGGDLTLATTGPDGTSFKLYLQQPRQEEATPP